MIDGGVVNVDEVELAGSLGYDCGVCEFWVHAD